MAYRALSLVIPFIAGTLLSAGVFAAQDMDGRKPLLIVRFNQEHVYFNRALKQAVTNAEAAKPGIHYNVVSYVPSGAKKGQMKVSAEQAKTNLGMVTKGLQELGVDSARVDVSSQPSSAVTSQEVRIFVE